MDETFFSRRHTVAASRAAPFLTQSIADHIQHKVDRSSGFAIADVIKWNIPMDALASPNLSLPPKCIDDFLFSMQQILSSDASELIRSQAQAFDESVGIHGLADKFIGLRPAREAMLDVIDGIAHWAENSAAQAVPFHPEQADPSTLASGQQHANQPGNEERHPSAEGSSTMVLGSTTGQPSANTEPCPIIQLQLEGSTILEAWNGNPTTRAMEQLANMHERNADPTHFSFRALPVYHGTDASAGFAFQGSDEIRHGMLYGSVTANQVAPRHPSLPILWTGFSPLRCFLWAVFKSDVLQPVPGPTVQSKLKTSWKCGDHEHVGVLLFKFQPALPSAPGEASYIIPPGREQEWTTLARAQTGSGAPESWWRQFAPIHRKVQPTWPETIHCREYGAQMSMLLPYIKQFWTTVWFGTGITTLQASHQVTYSISFTQPRLEAPPTDKDTKAKKHRTST
ncbi:hypothetical protein B0T16DRAFT_8003 [Cercophora newfieldiana]|uniref:Uncharacterized protein n=1 Tax=Cercophora newfieldiana TaxID=92897 RepID=A0AA39YP82_9PEZI|nr:hypothetical protein B0T16DRAFT_8003 [Cercophora newfieldiana]